MEEERLFGLTRRKKSCLRGIGRDPEHRPAGAAVDGAPLVVGQESIHRRPRRQLAVDEAGDEQMLKGPPRQLAQLEELYRGSASACAGQRRVRQRLGEKLRELRPGKSHLAETRRGARKSGASLFQCARGRLVARQGRRGGTLQGVSGFNGLGRAQPPPQSPVREQAEQCGAMLPERRLRRQPPELVDDPLHAPRRFGDGFRIAFLAQQPG